MLTDKELEELTSGSILGEEKKVSAMLKLMDTYQKTLDTAGTAKWFIPGGPYPIEKCPKHKLFFDATKKYNELLFCAGNRVGKTLTGAYTMACHLTGGQLRPSIQ